MNLYGFITKLFLFFYDFYSFKLHFLKTVLKQTKIVLINTMCFLYLLILYFYALNASYSFTPVVKSK